MNPFNCKHPCKSCPYRKDAPLAHWDKDHFQDLVNYNAENEGKAMPLYQCHKKDGNICAGWMLDQIDHGLPSIPLRLKLIKTKEPGLLDTFFSKVERYDNINQMALANFPDIDIPKPDNDMDKFIDRLKLIYK